MQIYDILLEKKVMSSWIYDITYQRKTKTLFMTLGNGRRYAIYDFSRRDFERWYRASSKGKFWHTFVKGFYEVERIF